MTNGVAQGIVLALQSGQQLEVRIDDVATVALLDANHQAVPGTMTKDGRLVYTISTSGNYTLVLMGVGQVHFQIRIP